MDLTTIVENIVKPQHDLEVLSINFKNSRITNERPYQEMICLSFFVNDKINILNVLNWFKYKIKEFCKNNKIKSLKLINWDDTKEFDFNEKKYELYITLSIERYEYNYIFDKFKDVYNIGLLGTYLIN